MHQVTETCFCSTQQLRPGPSLSLLPGQEAWVQKLKWTDLPKFNQLKWKPLHSDPESLETSAFVKRYKNLAFYWILRAGHMVRASPLLLQIWGRSEGEAPGS